MPSLLVRLGQDPKHSLTLFVRGLGFFMLGVLFIALGYFQHHLWQIPGLFFIGLGSLVAAWGYLGLLANRLTASFQRNKAKTNKNSPF